jgi:molecular chaperone HtpG
LAWSHNRVEGKREYTTLLYVPSHAPFDLWNRDGSRGLKLYVKRVFILDDAEQFLPLYLRFIKGVVDSSDLPLNVSRELLQTDADIEAMRSGIARRVLDLLAKLAKDEPEKYATFWKEFGQVLKEGIAEDSTNRDRIAKLLRFCSTHTDLEQQDQSLDDYLSRLKPEQTHIYYLTAETWNAARHSPHLERLRKHGVEVLLMHDRVDEWMLSYLGEYEGKTFQDVAAGDLDLGALAPAEEAAPIEGADALCGRLKEILADRVDAVKTTQRLAESPACLVRAAGDMSAQMRRLMEAAGQGMPAQKPILEINPAHPLVMRLQATEDAGAFRDLAFVLADQATLAEGGQLAEPAEFVRRMNRLLLGGTAAQ